MKEPSEIPEDTSPNPDNTPALPVDSLFSGNFEMGSIRMGILVSRLPSRTIPATYERIVLVNPTKYLGNLLIAGGLIQDFQRFCEANGKHLLIVFDESFRDLVAGALPESRLLFYPRGSIKSGNATQQMRHYLEFLFRIRSWRADIAFNIEEDVVAHRLTQFSGARFKLGCSTARHGWGYDHVVPVAFAERPPGRRHRWFSFFEVFAALGLPETSPERRPGYLRLPPSQLPEVLVTELMALGVMFTMPLVAIHAGATKDYKKWPEENFVELASLLIAVGLQPVFIGAGGDKAVAERILTELSRRHTPGLAVNLCSRLSLSQLAVFFTKVAGMVGNDSGPFHLASALGVPGVVMFGPTAVDLWHPLAAASVVIKGSEPCSAECTRKQCLYDHRCLKSVSPAMIMERLLPLLAKDRLRDLSGATSPTISHTS